MMLWTFMFTTLSFDVFSQLRSKVIESCSVLPLSYHWVITYLSPSDILVYHPVAFFDLPTHWDRIGLKDYITKICIWGEVCLSSKIIAFKNFQLYFMFTKIFSLLYRDWNSIQQPWMKQKYTTFPGNATDSVNLPNNTHNYLLQ